MNYAKEADPFRLGDACWLRAMGWARLTWCTAAGWDMAALRGNKMVSITLAEAIASNRKVDQEILDAATGSRQAGGEDGEGYLERV